MNNGKIKEIHPQKYYMRLASNALFYLGSGRYWYEAEKTRFPRLYAFWCVVINVYVAAGTLYKVAAYFRTDLTTEERFQFIQLTCTEIPILLKFYFLFLKQQKVRCALKNLVDGNRDIFTSSELETQAVKKAKTLIYVIYMGSYAYMTLLTVQKIAFYFTEGMPIETQPIYFPTNAHVGYVFFVCRILLICHFWVLILMVLTADCFAIMALIFVASKFKQVQMYFEMMRKNPEALENPESFEKFLVNGMKLHEDALWCARNIQSSLGPVYGIHICMTIVMLTICLLKFAVSERTLVNLALNMLLSFILTLATGCYMIISGNITHEAAAVAPAVFHCGWERVRRLRSARALVVVAVQRAQRPVHMTAYGFLVLSHETFISVLHSVYSFFAVVY